MRAAIRWLLGITMALVSIGMIVLASAGNKRGELLHGDINYFVKRQAIWLVVALVFMVAVIFFDYHHWRNHNWLTIGLFVAVLVLLGAVFLFPPVNGSYRWMRLGSLRFQPSEMGKLSAVLCVSVMLDKLGWRVEQFVRGALMPCFVAGIIVAFLIAEPDFGSSFVVLAACGVLMFLGGNKLWHLGLLFGGGIAVVVAFVAQNKNRMDRMMAWLTGNESGTIDSESVRNARYQLEQAVRAISQGGYFGVGYNQSMQKQYYLPEAHTDFIFAIGAEEWGLLFSLIIVLLFVGIFICGLYISLHATDRLGRLLAFGMTFVIVVQAIVNIGVVTGCLPTKGLALPFISYGGTNLISALVAVGMVVNVARVTLRTEREQTPRVVPARVIS